MKKKLTRIIVGIILVVLILLGFFAYKEMNDYTNIIKLNRGIEIPKELGYKELYSKDQGASFHGDGIRYHVYSYEKEEVAESMLNRTDIINSKPENQYYELANILYQKLDIKRFYPPITQIEYGYYQKKKDNSEILILLNDIQKEIYIFESFL